MNKMVIEFKNNKEDIVYKRYSTPFFHGKKGVELSLTMIVIFILGVIVLITIIYFFSGNFLDGTTDLKNISDGVLGEYKIL